MESSQYDVVIIGGGILGLSTAMQLLERAPRWRVAVVEKEDGLAIIRPGTIVELCILEFITVQDLTRPSFVSPV